MKHYVGIDLGTTNSSICSYDGKNMRIWKSPEQNDVTPSAIYIDKRGNRYYGRRAYDAAPANEKNSAILFKRFLGTSTKFNFETVKLSLTPEECSAEILKVLFGSLPEEIRNDLETATVITVPAAFNQMKKNATLEAARLAGIGRVALMQEPVAAIMSIMRFSKQQGIFLVYDLGGGTFDVSVAENIRGKVNLLVQGGKEMCGGRDWDRMIFNNIVVPWLQSHFKLPNDFLTNEQYKTLRRLSLFAAEQAKIELSSIDETTIRMDESRVNITDLNGNEVYLEVPFTRAALDTLVAEVIEDTIEVIRDTLKTGGLTTNDIDKVVFIGGPTNYKPLRDKVSAELALPANIDVNPMTAVAEGASIFAESIDWSDEQHHRRAENAELPIGLDISFRYTARTSGDTAKVAVKLNKTVNLTMEITSTDTGWTSGRISLSIETLIDLPLQSEGENSFIVAVFDQTGRPVNLKDNRIVVTKTMATFGSIPASHAIAIEALDKLGGVAIPIYLVHENDPLPRIGQITLKAGQMLKAGSNDTLTFKLWEGSIQDPITDNRYIGTYKIPGTSFDSGIIPTGADILCEYEMADSGAIHLGVSIPCVGADFGSRNFYSMQEGQIDLSDIEKITDSGRDILERIDELTGKIEDPRLDKARHKANKTASLSSGVVDPEVVHAGYNELLETKKLLAQTRKDHLKEIRQIDLDSCVKFFNDVVRQYAKLSEAEAFDNLARNAQRAIARNETGFDNQLHEMKRKNFSILWQQDWFVIEMFNNKVKNTYNFSDKKRFEELKRAGLSYIKEDKIDELRRVIASLVPIEIIDTSGETMLDEVNVIRG